MFQERMDIDFRCRLSRAEVCVLKNASAVELRQDLDVAFRSIDPDALPIANALRCALDADDGWQTIFARNHRTVGHQPTDFRHESLDRHEQRRPTRISKGCHQDIARLEVGVCDAGNDTRSPLDNAR